MTTLGHVMKRCAVCGGEALYTFITSTNARGSPDLDTRPPEMERSTIDAWVQRCPECGYCASDVSEAPPQAAEVVRSPGYSRQLTDPNYPGLANSFLCKALIEESASSYGEAAWSLVCAAWACDDARKAEAAKVCRSKAADMIDRALSEGQMFSGESDVDTAVRVDLLRRAGRFDEARRLIEEKRHTITDELVAKILEFEDALISKGDQGCHRVAEVPGES